MRLEIASTKVPGWNEIDAVGLMDAKGDLTWADSARASTTYAEQNVAAPPPPPVVDPEVERLRQENEELRQKLEALQKHGEVV